MVPDDLIQMCYVHLILEEVYHFTAKLIPKDISMNTSRELPQYFIQKWKLAFMDQKNINRGLKMEIVFKRRLTNELLTTYLPSLLLLGITYATTFFKSFFFEAALTVNLTVMLVLTTLFISVMEKLPSTSYVRLVDIWLICGQLIPFIEVILITLMELYNEEDNHFNHHGFMRRGGSISQMISPAQSNKEDKNKDNDNEIKIKILKIIEKKIVPGLFLLFSLVYWTFGLLCYYDFTTHFTDEG